MPTSSGFARGRPDGGGETLDFSGFWPRPGCIVKKMIRNNAHCFMALGPFTLRPAPQSGVFEIAPESRVAPLAGDCASAPNHRNPCRAQTRHYTESTSADLCDLDCRSWRNLPSNQTSVRPV